MIETIRLKQARTGQIEFDTAIKKMSKMMVKGEIMKHLNKNWFIKSELNGSDICEKKLSELPIFRIRFENFVRKLKVSQ